MIDAKAFARLLERARRYGNTIVSVISVCKDAGKHKAYRKVSAYGAAVATTAYSPCDCRSRSRSPVPSGNTT